MREGTPARAVHIGWVSIGLLLVLLVGSDAARGAPTLDSAVQIATRAVDLDWSESAPEVDVLYQVERAASATGPWALLVDANDRDDTRRFTDTRLPASTGTFYYRISADYDGNPNPVVSNVVSVALDPACDGYCAALGMDRDGDGTLDASDNCVALANDQSDADGDGIGDACDVPADYGSFVSVAAGDSADFIAKVQATPGTATHLYLPPGNYFFDETIEIQRTAPLLIHGAGRTHTNLVANAGVNPLFRITDAEGASAGTHIQLSNLRIQLPNGLQAAGVVGLSLETNLAVHLDLTEIRFQRLGLAVRGAGFVRLQAAGLNSQNFLEQALLVDHPDADVFVIGGGMGGGGGAPLPGIDRDEVSLVRQKAGRVRVYTSTIGGTRGPADFWLESSAKFGPHVIAGLRTEGANASGYTCFAPEDEENMGDSEFLTSRLLRVPATDERVDVLVKGVLAAWSGSRSKCEHTHYMGLWNFAEYSSPGRLWLVGNATGNGAEHYTMGSAPGAHVLSAGNQGFGPVLSIIDVGGTGSLVSVGDYGAFNHHCAETENKPLGDPPCNQGPTHRFYLPDGSGGYAADYDPAYDPSDPQATPPDTFETVASGMVEIPRDEIPPALDRPRVLEAFPGMVDVKAAFGAVGDGTTDDTAAIQAALIGNGSGGGHDAAVLYFPAGTYCITSTLYWNHQNLTDSGVPYGNSDAVEGNDGGNLLIGGNGGWWAGAGSDATTLRFDEGCDGSLDEGNLFATQKMSRHTVQGMTFETEPYDGNGDTKTFWVENYHYQCTPQHPLDDWPECDAVVASEPARDQYDAPDLFFLGVTTGGVFQDMAFRGGARAFAMAIETHANSDLMMLANSEFSDAGTGLSIENFNAVGEVIYEGRFLRNDKSLGDGGWSDFSVYRAEVDGGICPRNWSGQLYVYGVDDTSGGCTSYSAAQLSINLPLKTLFDNSTLSPAGPGPHIDRDANGATIFLHSEVLTPLSVELGSDAVREMESLLSLQTEHSPWQLAAPPDDTQIESEFESPLGCSSAASSGTPDGDGDGVRDACDNCLGVSNPGQEDHDLDGIGTACDLPCDDGFDNDDDGLTDHPDDPGCFTIAWEREDPACSDGIDNDGQDGTDLEDVGCGGAAWRQTENPACQDGVDNDGDGLYDYDGAGISDPDPECGGNPVNSSEGGACGLLGIEILPMLGLVGLARRRRGVCPSQRAEERP